MPDERLDRIEEKYKAAQERLQAARERDEDDAAEAADEELKSLLLFKSDMGAYLRLYTFLSPIFDYGDLLQAAHTAAGVRSRARGN